MSAEELMSLADLSALQKVLHSRAAWTCHRVLFLLDGLLDAAPAELNRPDVAAIQVDGIVSSLDGCFPRGTWACKPVFRSSCARQSGRLPGTLEASAAKSSGSDTAGCLKLSEEFSALCRSRCPTATGSQASCMAAPLSLPFLADKPE